MKTQNTKWKFEITELPNGGFTIASYKGVASFDNPIVIAAASKTDLSGALIECIEAERSVEDKS